MNKINAPKMISTNKLRYVRVKMKVIALMKKKTAVIIDQVKLISEHNNFCSSWKMVRLLAKLKLTYSSSSFLRKFKFSN